MGGSRNRLFMTLALAGLAISTLAVVDQAPAVADTTFWVDTTSDDGALSACTVAPGDCSLRGAIATANATAGTDTIGFAIPGAQCPSGICPITVVNGPLDITEALTIDGTTQPQNAGPQANVCATETEPSHMRIEVIADPGVGVDPQIFVINHATGASNIRGFALGDNGGAFLSGAVNAIAGNGHHISCNHFGVDAAGDSQLGSADFWGAILVESGADGLIVGTDGDGVDDIGERNVFGSQGYSIYINSNDDNVLAGNYFGFTSDGVTNIGAGPVLIRQSSSNNLVGTNEDGVSDELERNYFGNATGPTSLTLPASGSSVPIDNLAVGNTFGISPAGTAVSLGTAMEISELGVNETGWEIRDNVFVGAATAVSVSGDEAGASVLISDNVFGVGTGGASVPNGDSISLQGLGSHVVRDNLVANSTVTGLVLADSAGLASGSIDNCLTGNTAGFDNGTTNTPTFTNNWWGATDGPSGAGSGSGDSVGADVNFTPWLTNPPAQCNTAPNVGDATLTINAGAAIGTSVGTVAATDDGADLAFAITAGNTGGVFAIGATTGEITMAGTPDFPATTSYALTAEATDTGTLSDTATVTINLTNQAPVAGDTVLSVAEDAPAGTTVGTVPATDGDGDSLDFTIAAGDTGGVFAVDSNGLVTVAGSLDYETTPSYSLTIDVSDGFASDTATVTVTVTDAFEVPVTATFGDVPLDHTFFADVEWLAAGGITKGCNPPTNDLFCPDDAVTRGQMAAFLHRALDGVLTPGAPVTFNDITGSVFAADIEWLGAVGVTKGCNPPTNDMYCPDGEVTRGQMAAFLVRALGYTAGAGLDQFTDDDGSIFEADIERLAEAGVTRGCNPPTNDMFCPNDAVTRAQMAAFLHRALG